YCCLLLLLLLLFFFFTDPPTSEIYTLSLHDALPILIAKSEGAKPLISRLASAATVSEAKMMSMEVIVSVPMTVTIRAHTLVLPRSEEHTSELQSLAYLVCRLLLEKKKKSKE